VPRISGYIDSLSRCQNRCQVLRVYPFNVDMERPTLPEPMSWDDFRLDIRKHRMRFAVAMGDSPFEAPEQRLNLYKMESKPMVLFQAAELCKASGTDRLNNGCSAGALDKYSEGIYIMDKCREVLTTWRLVFKQVHDEKAEKDRKSRGLKHADLPEPPVPEEFRSDEREQHSLRLALLLNAALAALRAQCWDVVESRAGEALELEPQNVKAFYRRGMGRLGAGRSEAAKEDFWSVLRASNFTNKEALSQLAKLMPADEVQKQVRKRRAEAAKEIRLRKMVTEMDQDDRVALQEERYQRYHADCEQRQKNGQKEISFDEWVNQYEWRYDAEERAKMRTAWPGCFSRAGPAPLPVESWEVDYLTHKEVDKLVYHRQTQALAEARRQKEGSPAEAQKEGFHCKLQVDEEDLQILKTAVVQKGYNYWW